MFYYNPESLIIPRLPRTFMKNDGSLFLNFNLASSSTHVNYGFYIVRSDNNVPPTKQSREIVPLRIVNVDGIYVDIIRYWTFDNYNT